MITYVRVVDGTLTTHEKCLMMSTGAAHEVLEVGVISPEPTKTNALSAGEVGYVIPGVKNVRQARVGDTMTSAARPASRVARRLPRPAADGLLRPLSDRRRPVPRPA